MFGEVSEPNIETVNLVEEIVRDQVVEIVSISRATYGVTTAQLDMSRLVKQERTL